MTDNKLTDNEIMALLECCSHSSCSNCLYDKKCDGYTSIKLALDLINRLQAEIEKRDRVFENLIEVARLWKEEYANAKKELFHKTAQVKTTKAEAYKEFADEIFELFPTDKPNTVISRVTVKHILKELVGEDNGNKL